MGSDILQYLPASECLCVYEVGDKGKELAENFSLRNKELRCSDLLGDLMSSYQNYHQLPLS